MGWYRVNYDHAESFEWGQGMGCNFVNVCLKKRRGEKGGGEEGEGLKEIRTRTREEEVWREKVYLRSVPLQGKCAGWEDREGYFCSVPGAKVWRFYLFLFSPLFSSVQLPIFIIHY